MDPRHRWWSWFRDLASRDLLFQTKAPWCRWVGATGQEYAFVWEWDEDGEDEDDVNPPSLVIVEEFISLGPILLLVTFAPQGWRELYILSATNEVNPPH